MDSPFTEFSDLIFVASQLLTILNMFDFVLTNWIVALSMYIFYNKIIFCCKRCLSSVENIQSCRTKRKVLQKEFTHHFDYPKTNSWLCYKKQSFWCTRKNYFTFVKEASQSDCASLWSSALVMYPGLLSL